MQLKVRIFHETDYPPKGVNHVTFSENSVIRKGEESFNFDT